MFGKTQSVETKFKKSISLTGQKRSDDVKKKQSLSSIKSGQAKSVDVFEYDSGKYVGRYYAIAEACRVLGFYSVNSKASLVANGNRNQTHGYIFKFV